MGFMTLHGLLANTFTRFHLFSHETIPTKYEGDDDEDKKDDDRGVVPSDIIHMMKSQY